MPNNPSLELGHFGVIDIGRLASYPLLLLDQGYSIRRLFDAACRLTDVEPNRRGFSAGGGPVPRAMALRAALTNTLALKI